LSKLAQFIEELLLPVIALTALVLSLADVFGLLPLVPQGRIPGLTLSIVSLILAALIFIQRRSIEIHKQTQHLYEKMTLEQIDEKLLEQIDTELRMLVTDDYFLDQLEALQVAVKESKVQVNSILQTRYYLIRTLQEYPRATFLYTQCPAAFNLWEDKLIKKAITSFIQSGGKIEQFLFVKDAQEFASKKIQKKIKRQQAMGVKVHIVDSSVSTAVMQKNLFVESNGRIAWELHENSGYLSAMVTTNKKQVMSFCRNFEKLRESKRHK